MLLPIALTLALLPAPILGQNLGAYLTTCAPSAPIPAVDTGIVNGYPLASNAVCLPSDTPPDDGFEICPAPSLFDAYFTDTTVYFRCAKSLSPTCDGGCPPGTFCISNLVPSSPIPFYFCGVPCAGGFYLCDDTATKVLNPSWTAFCDPIADQCGTCTSSDSLLENGGCTSSAVVSALPARASSRKRGFDTVIRHHRLPQMGVSKGLQTGIEDAGCPPKSRKCPIQGVLEDWVCVAVHEDIESCGGCPGKGGVDCTELPGVKFGAATCSDGICKAHRCIDDGSYVLVNSTCVPSAALGQVEDVTVAETTPRASPSLHPDLSTDVLIPEAIRILSGLPVRQNHDRQHGTRDHHLESNLHSRAKSTWSSRDGQPYRFTRIKQARIKPEIKVTIHLEYSNPAITFSSPDDHESHPADPSQAAHAITTTESWKARINTLPNVRILPSTNGDVSFITSDTASENQV